MLMNANPVTGIVYVSDLTLTKEQKQHILYDFGTFIFEGRGQSRPQR